MAMMIYECSNRSCNWADFTNEIKQYASCPACKSPVHNYTDEDSWLEADLEHESDDEDLGCEASNTSQDEV